MAQYKTSLGVQDRTRLSSVSDTPTHYMSTIENPSEQVQVVIDALKDYAAGDITAFGDKFTEVRDI